MNITYTDGTQATYTISFTGSAYAPATLPLTEGWENGQGTWIFVNGTQTNAWYIGAGDATYGPYEGDNFAYISNEMATQLRTLPVRHLLPISTKISLSTPTAWNSRFPSSGDAEAKARPGIG